MTLTKGRDMQGTTDTTCALGTMPETQRGTRRSALVGGALALALLAGGATAAALAADSGADPRRAADAQDALRPGAPAPLAQDADVQAADVQGADAQDAGAQPAGGTDGGTGTASGSDAGTEGNEGTGSGSSDSGSSDGGDSDSDAAADAVPAGTYGVRVLGEGWDARGRYVLVDRGRLTDGPAAEPGVDGTRPVLFDTGAVAERRRLDLADDHQFRFSRSGGEPSYGSGSWADFVTELSGRAAGMLATVQVDPDGRLRSLEEPYRP